MRVNIRCVVFFDATATTGIYALALHGARPVGMDDLAVFSVGIGQARMRFLNIHTGELSTVIGFRKAETWSDLAFCIWRTSERDSPLRALTSLSTLWPASMLPR